MLRRAEHFGDLRERMGSTYTKGYGIFRRYFITIGQRMVESGRLGDRDDVFLLSLDELKLAINDKEMDISQLARTRREEISSLSGLVLPETIVGDSMPPPITNVERQLTGVAGSRGIYRGTSRVVRSMDDFHKVQQGDVVIIPYSDISWGSIFAKAGAIVSESGGILSHSSIVAREYGIPAVVSVKGAMLIEDGRTILVDGTTGKVMVE